MTDKKKQKRVSDKRLPRTKTITAFNSLHGTKATVTAKVWSENEVFISAKKLKTLELKLCGKECYCGKMRFVGGYTVKIVWAPHTGLQGYHLKKED